MNVKAKLLNRERIKSNGWCFGRCFDNKSAPELFELLSEKQQNDAATCVVVTHDCSLIHPSLESEPYLEYIVAKPIHKESAQNTEAKNIRCLHLPLSVNGESRFFELKMAQRGFIDRMPIENSKPSEQYILPADSKAILVRWLSNRYTTQTLPDSFDRRIKPLIEGKKKPLRKLLQEPAASKMLGVYIDINPHDIDLEDGRPYKLVVLLLYRSDAFEDEAIDLDEYADRIKDCLSKAEGVDVLRVVPISEKNVSVERYRRMRRWQMDFISFRDLGDDVALIEDNLS